MPNNISYQELVIRIKELESENQRLKNKIQEHRTLFNLTKVAIFISDFDDNILEFNNKALEIFGYEQDDLEQSSSMLKIHKNHKKLWEKIKLEIRTKGCCSFETNGQKKNGSLFYLESECSLISFKGKHCIYSIMFDVSDRKILEKKFFDEKQKWQMIFDSIPALIFIKDKENRLIGINSAFKYHTGYSEEQIIGANLFEIMHDKELAETYWKDDIEVFETGIPKRNILEPLMTDKSKWYLTDKIPFVTHNNEIIGIIGYSIDITERKNAEESLLRSEKKFRLIFETSPEGTALISLDGKILSVNKALTTMVGYSEEELKNMTFKDITDVNWFETERNNKGVLEEKIGLVKTEVIRKDKKIVPALITGWIIMDDYGKPLQRGVFVKDLTIEKKAEELQRSLYLKEKEQFEKDLETKNRELSTKITQLIETNELVNNVVSKLEKLNTQTYRKKNKEIQSIIRNLKFHIDEDLWSQFSFTFGQIHKSFYEKLFTRFPNLTPNEKKLCAFMKMNLSTKDISSITHQSIRSIEVARSRLRNKMKLGRKDNLVKYLSQF